MAGIFHPTRGGNRGGKDQFKWEDVKEDKDRENYLGKHSVSDIHKSTAYQPSRSGHYNNSEFSENLKFLDRSP